MEKVLSHTRKVLVNDNKGGNLMVLPLDQMLKGGSPRQQKDNSGANNLPRLPPVSSGSASANNAGLRTMVTYGPTPCQRAA